VARKSNIARDKKRAKLHARYYERRKELKLKLAQLYKNPLDNQEEIQKLTDKLDAMPKNSSSSRVRLRCKVTGRPRGVYRRFGLGRNILRKLAMLGYLPGVRKSSW